MFTQLGFEVLPLMNLHHVYLIDTTKFVCLAKGNINTIY